MKNKIEVIDFIKGYSILSIVLFHYCQGINVSPMFSRAINFGGTGIHTFLFASGFGLFLSYLQRPLSYSDFLKKRFTKIYIPYIIVVTGTALISLLIPLYENSWNNYFSHVFMYKMFSDQLIGSYGYQLWFISTIIQFYLLFFLIVRMRRWFPGRSFLSVGLVISWSWAALILLLHKEELRNWNSFFLIYLWEFVLGMYCAEHYLKNGYAFWKIAKTGLLSIAVAGLVIYSLMAIQFGRPGKIFNDLPGLFGYGALCLLIYTLHIKPVNRFILFTSTISFSIFLIHFLVLNLMQAACRAMHISWTWLMLIPAIILCYVLAIPLQKFFDQLVGGLMNHQQTQKVTRGTNSTGF
jgi:peptidoglycan/LPS O-acetylase OafA/YrhL